MKYAVVIVKLIVLLVIALINFGWLTLTDWFIKSYPGNPLMAVLLGAQFILAMMFVGMMCQYFPDYVPQGGFDDNW